VLLAPFAPAPGNPPFGCRPAHCLNAAWAFELRAKPPGAPAGGLPPEKPAGGPPLAPRAGNFNPCLDKHFWNAENDEPDDFEGDDFAVVRFVAALLTPPLYVVRARLMAQTANSARTRWLRLDAPRRERRVVFMEPRVTGGPVTSIQESRGFPEGVSAIASRRIAGVGYPQGPLRWA